MCQTNTLAMKAENFKEEFVAYNWVKCTGLLFRRVLVCTPGATREANPGAPASAAAGAALLPAAGAGLGMASFTTRGLLAACLLDGCGCGRCTSCTHVQHCRQGSSTTLPSCVWPLEVYSHNDPPFRSFACITPAVLQRCRHQHPCQAPSQRPWGLPGTPTLPRMTLLGSASAVSDDHITAGSASCSARRSNVSRQRLATRRRRWR
jgi:hypothetical protein